MKNNWTTPKRSQNFMCFIAFVIDELLGGWASSPPPFSLAVMMLEVESQARFVAQNNSPGSSVSSDVIFNVAEVKENQDNLSALWKMSVN